MLNHSYSYAQTLKIAERPAWRVEDLIGGPDRSLDFTRPFMPEALARTQAVRCLNESERLLFNQIRGHSYLSIFIVVEEFILPFLLDHMRARLDAADEEVRSLLQFAGEEAKHIQLFRAFEREFREGFRTRCDVIGPASEIGRAVLAHHPLAVGLTILMIEWMTQAHYLESVRDDQGLDPQFKNLLKHHWIEEAQHAKLDTLIVEALAARLSPEERARALDEYLEIGAFLDGGLAAQLELDIQAFERASGRTLRAEERAELLAVQRKAVRYTYIGSGMVHPKFRETLRALGADLERRVAAVAPEFC